MIISQEYSRYELLHLAILLFDSAPKSKYFCNDILKVQDYLQGEFGIAPEQIDSIYWELDDKEDLTYNLEEVMIGICMLAAHNDYLKSKI